MPGHNRYAATDVTSGASCNARDNSTTPQLSELLSGSNPVAVYMSTSNHSNAAGRVTALTAALAQSFAWRLPA